jgi:cytochrome c oxidase subunit 2
LTFVVFAIAAVAWSAGVLRWAFSMRTRRAGKLIAITSCVAIVAGAASAIADLHALHLGRTARSSNVAIRMMRHGDWWQLDYSRRGVSFTTANELHVPAGAAVRLAWSGAPVVWVSDAVCLRRSRDDCVLIFEGTAPRMARFAGLWPPMWGEVAVIPQRPDQFDGWFRNEAQPARAATGAGQFLFVNSGCGYCHVIRGVTTEPSAIAPDLTHFAERRTIAGTRLPIRRGELTGWVVHSRALKRHSLMPDNLLDPGALHPLITYLGSLR